MVSQYAVILNFRSSKTLDKASKITQSTPLEYSITDTALFYSMN